jgi:hypothetical protein
MSGIKNVQEVAELSRRFPRKLFVVVGQAEGNQPNSRTGRDMLYLANLKIWVEGYRAISRGRSFGAQKYLTVWEREAAKYWVKPAN